MEVGHLSVVERLDRGIGSRSCSPGSCAGLGLVAALSRSAMHALSDPAECYGAIRPTGQLRCLLCAVRSAMQSALDREDGQSGYNVASGSTRFTDVRPQPATNAPPIDPTLHDPIGYAADSLLPRRVATAPPFADCTRGQNGRGAAAFDCRAVPITGLHGRGADPRTFAGAGRAAAAGDSGTSGCSWPQCGIRLIRRCRRPGCSRAAGRLAALPGGLVDAAGSGTLEELDPHGAGATLDELARVAGGVGAAHGWLARKIRAVR